MFDLPHWFNWDRFSELSDKMRDIHGHTDTSRLSAVERQEWRRMRRHLDEIDAGLHGQNRRW